MRGQRRAAVRGQLPGDDALGAHGARRGRVVHGGEPVRRVRVVCGDLDGERALSDGGQAAGRRQPLGDARGESQPVESGAGEHGGVEVAPVQAAQPGVHIAAQVRQAQVRPPSAQLRLAAQACGADAAARGQLRERAPGAADQGVASVRAGADGAEDESVGQLRRHVLHGVHGDVCIACEQALLQLLEEQALAAEVGERLHGAVPGGADAQQFAAQAVRARQRLRHQLGLPQRQRAGAGGDAAGGHGRGLRIRTGRSPGS